MPDTDLNKIKSWVAAKGCDVELHDRIWRTQQTGCPRCRMFNPNWKDPESQNTPQTRRTAAPENVIDLTTSPSASSPIPPSCSPPSSGAPMPRQTKQTFGHGTGAYSALAGPADQKRLAGPVNTTKNFLKATHAGAPAHAFRPEIGKKIPAKSEKELDVTWVMHLVTWIPEDFPNVESIQSIGKFYYYVIS
jgi:hypothetical protein